MLQDRQQLVIILVFHVNGSNGKAEQTNQRQQNPRRIGNGPQPLAGGPVADQHQKQTGYPHRCIQQKIDPGPKHGFVHG
ncbi:hypothetical protein D3C80_2091140 [compost metagenome]